MLTFAPMPGVLPSTARAVGILQGHGELNIHYGLSRLKEKELDDLKSRMDHWIAGNDGPAKYFHGFPSRTKHKRCFVFKKGTHRFYGFLYHPQPKTNPRFHICVLVIYATKKEWETDEAELDRANQWLNNPNASIAIGEVFSDEKRGKRWTQ